MALTREVGRLYDCIPLGHPSQVDWGDTCGSTGGLQAASRSVERSASDGSEPHPKVCPAARLMPLYIATLLF